MKSIFKENSKELNPDGINFLTNCKQNIFDFVYEYAKKGYDIIELKYIFDSSCVEVFQEIENEVIRHYNNIDDPNYRPTLEKLKNISTGEIIRGHCVGSDTRGRIILKYDPGYEPICPYTYLKNSSGEYWLIENKYKDK